MSVVQQGEFLVDKLSINIDEQGFELVFKRAPSANQDKEDAFSVRIPANRLLKLVVSLFQAGVVYQDSFHTMIGFPSKEGKLNEEETNSNE